MRRNALLTPLAVVLLAPLLAGCDDAADPPQGRATIALGTLPAELPSPDTTSEVGATDVTTTSEPAAPSREDPPRSAGPDPTATEPAPTDPPEDVPTRFVEVLAGLVEDEIPTEVPSTTLRDETGRLRVTVPRGWTDRRTEPALLADGSETPSLGASPDLTSFLDGYDTPGLTALVVADEPAAALDAYAFDEDCQNRRRGPYRGDRGDGRYEVWASCGGTVNDIVTIAVRPDAADETVLLLVQIVGPQDLLALDTALASLDLRS